MGVSHTGGCRCILGTPRYVFLWRGSDAPCAKPAVHKFLLGALAGSQLLQKGLAGFQHLWPESLGFNRPVSCSDPQVSPGRRVGGQREVPEEGEEPLTVELGTQAVEMGFLLRAKLGVFNRDTALCPVIRSSLLEEG